MFALAASAAFIVGACSSGGTPVPSSGSSAGASRARLGELGAGEGRSLERAAGPVPGYAEDGTTDPAYDWVTPFETETGCKITVQTFGTPMRRSRSTDEPGAIDVVSASGDASHRLVRAGYVQPVNVDLVPSYAEIFPDLKDKPYNTFDGVHYGIPHGRGSNLLMCEPTSSLRRRQRGPRCSTRASKFKVSVYDAPIYIADAAVVLMATKPELNIKNPYALDDTQFKAAVDLLEAQKPTVGEDWNDYAKQIDVVHDGDTTIGTTWQIITQRCRPAPSRSSRSSPTRARRVGQTPG